MWNFPAAIGLTFAAEDDAVIPIVLGVMGGVVDPETNVFGGVDACDDSVRDWSGIKMGLACRDLHFAASKLICNFHLSGFETSSSMEWDIGGN